MVSPTSLPPPTVPISSVPPVVVLAYDGVAADEARALVEVLALAGLPVIVASVESGAVTSYHGQVVPARTVDGLGPVSALVVPGGMGIRQAAGDADLLAAIGRLAARVAWLGATSTGSALLAAAGVVPTGSRLTTHWLAGELITDRGLQLVQEPFVEHGRLLTASGLASTGSLAFRLIGALAGANAEAQARARYRPGPAVDPRYRAQPAGQGGEGASRALVRPALRSGRRPRRRAGPLSHPIDPDGLAEVVIIQLDDGV